MLNEKCLVRPASTSSKTNKLEKPKSKISGVVHRHLKGLADSWGERYYVYGENVPYPKFVDPVEGEWFAYYLSLQWNRWYM